MQETEDKLELLSLIDILVDGRFELAKKDLTLQFRGVAISALSMCRRLFEASEVVLWKDLWES